VPTPQAAEQRTASAAPLKVVQNLGV
jgi:hypothetical protein